MLIVRREKGKRNAKWEKENSKTSKMVDEVQSRALMNESTSRRARRVVIFVLSSPPDSTRRQQLNGERGCKALSSHGTAIFAHTIGWIFQAIVFFRPRYFEIRNHFESQTIFWAVRVQPVNATEHRLGEHISAPPFGGKDTFGVHETAIADDEEEAEEI